MILETSATLQLMSALVEVGAAGGTREHLIRKAGVGTTTFYRAIKPLLERGLVVEQGGRYVLPLSEDYNFHFKLWHDLERVYELEPQVRAEVLAIAAHARGTLGANLRCLWLVGSAAHGSLGPKSDLDFLAVTGKEVMYHPEGTRPVNFVVMGEADFRTKHRTQDNFVLGALQYGRLLHDAGFAQEFCAAASPVALAPRRLQEREELLESHREQFYFFFRAEEHEDAARALAAYASSLARLMLQAFGELPAGKPETIAMSSRLFGAKFGDALEKAMQRKLRGKAAMALQRRLSDYRERFQKHAQHLKDFMPLISGGPFEFEERVGALLREWGAEVEAQVGRHKGADFIVRTATGDMLLVECKSREGEMDATGVRQLAATAERFDISTLVLAANAYRRMPLLERPPAFVAAVRTTAEEHGVCLVTGEGLLQAHNRMHLEDLENAVILNELISGTASGGARGVLMRRGK